MKTKTKTKTKVHTAKSVREEIASRPSTIEKDPAEMGNSLSDWMTQNVRWKGQDGVARYGMVTHHPDSNKLFKQGKLVIEDMVLPIHSIIYITQVDKVLDFGGGNFDEYAPYKYAEEKFQEALVISQALPKGLHVGKLFRMGVADGYACYVVTKVNKTMAEVEWRGYAPDKYYDQVLGGGGTFPKKIISRLVEGEEMMNDIFGGDE